MWPHSQSRDLAIIHANFDRCRADKRQVRGSRAEHDQVPVDGGSEGAKLGIEFVILHHLLF